MLSYVLRPTVCFPSHHQVIRYTKYPPAISPPPCWKYLLRAIHVHQACPPGQWHGCE